MRVCTADYIDGNADGNASTFSENTAATGGAIYAAGSVTLNGTAITSNNAESQDAEIKANGGAIMVSEYGSVNATNVTVSGNTATLGGAIYFDGKTLSLVDGTVTDNGDGIYLAAGKLNVSGKPVVDAIYLPDGKYITVNGELTQGADITVTTQSTGVVFAKPDGQNITDLSAYVEYFTSSDRKQVSVNPDGELISGYVIFTQATLSNGYTITVSGTPTQYQWYSYTDGVCGDALEGQTTATLTGGENGKQYICKITYTFGGETTVIESQPVTYYVVSEHSHPICGATCECGETHQDVEWSPVTNEAELILAAENGGNYYLLDDINISNTITVSKDTKLCLNGKKIVGQGTGRMFSVPSDITFTLTDCGSAERAGYIDPITGLWTEGEYSGEGTAITYNLFGGVITGAQGGVISLSGTLNTYGINFVGTLSTSAGAVINGSGTLNDIGSVFVANMTSGQAGAVQISDATIKNTVFAYNKSTENRAGALLVTGTLNATGALFECNSANTNGGAIVLTGATKADLVSSTFKANTAKGNGGAIYYYNTPVMNTTSCSFIENSAARGGAIDVYSGSSYSDEQKYSDNGSTFEGNSSNGSGGAVYTSRDASFVGSIFKDNTAKNGGAIYLAKVYVAPTVTTSNVTFTGNSATANGGAVYVGTDATYTDGEAVLTDGEITGAINGSTFEENSAVNGGAICVEITKSTAVEGEAVLYGSTFNKNTASSYGGAIALIGCKASTYYCIFDENSATTNGGAIQATCFEYTSDEVTYRKISTLYMLGGEVKNSKLTVQSPSNSNYGGGLAVLYGSQAIIDGVTFDANKGYSGGAIASYGSATVQGEDDTVYTLVTLNNVTLKNNAGVNGAVYVGAAGQVIANNLVAENNKSTGNGAVFYTTSSSASTLIINGATISGNTDKNGIGFIVKNKTDNILMINRSAVDGDDVKITETEGVITDNWDVLIKGSGANSNVTDTSPVSPEQPEQ